MPVTVVYLAGEVVARHDKGLTEAGLVDLVRRGIAERQRRVAARAAEAPETGAGPAGLKQ